MRYACVPHATHADPPTKLRSQLDGRRPFARSTAIHSRRAEKGDPRLRHRRNEICAVQADVAQFIVAQHA